jgi:uncharacterized protein (TIGR03382 family)
MRSILLLAALAPSLALASNVQGTIFSNTTWSPADPPTMTGDVTVAAGVTLTIAAGTTVTASTSDGQAAGADTSKVELIVNGTLVVQGTSGSQVTFTSSGSTAGSWYGIRIMTGSSGHSITYATINEAVRGFEVNADTTASNIAVSTSTYGFFVNAGIFTLTGGSATGGSYGMQTQSGSTANVSNVVFATNASYGMYLQGAGTLHHITSHGNQYGAYVYNTGANAIVLRDSIFSSNSSYEIYRSSSSSASFTWTYSDYWNNGVGSVSNATCTSCFSSSPLYVGGGNYRITSNSPARQAGSDGSDIGALPYTSDATAGLQGTLYVNTTLSGANTVTGDLTVAPGVTLTLAAGATLTFPTNDSVYGGVDTSHAELIVRGTLLAQGTAGSPVTLTSSGSTASSWYGVRVIAGTGTVLNNVVLNEAIRGLDISVDTTASNFAVSTTQYGFFVTSGTLTLSGGSATGGTYGMQTQSGSVANVNNVVFANNASYGMYLQGAGTLHHITAHGNQYGAYVYNTGSNAITLRDSIFSSNSSYEIYRSSSSSAAFTWTYSDYWNNGVGSVSNATCSSNCFSTNPLYVGGGNYRLTSNSPARQKASDNSDLGALPYVSDATSGLQGTLYVNTTLTGTNTVLGDLIVAPGVTLTLAAGATLNFPTNDGMYGGVDTSRAELIVNGTLDVNGTSGSPVTLTSTGSTAGSWYGLRMVSGSGSTIDYLVISEATRGMETSVDTTAQNVAISTSTYGFFVNSGTLTLSGGSAVGGTYGMQTQSGSTANVNNVVFANNASYGMYLQGAGTLHHITSANNQYGAYVYNTGANAITLRDSIFSGNSSYEIYRSSSSSAAFNWTYSDYWNNGVGSSSNASCSNACFSTNPLYVGSGNYRLTSNSPARQKASDGSDLGALPYVSDATSGLQGTLYVNTTLSGANTILGDLIVAPGITLTLAPGATLTFPTNDSMYGGVDTSHAELIVNGTLAVNGSAASPVTLTSTGSTAGSWYGIRVASGTGTTIGYANITEAVRGIETSVDTTISNVSIGTSTYGFFVNAGTLTLTNSQAQNGTYGLQSQAGSTANVSYSVFNNNASYGMYLQGAGLLHHLTVASNQYGAYVYNTGGNAITLRDSIFSTNSSYEIYRSSSSSAAFTWTYSDYWNNGVGSVSNATCSSNCISQNPLYVAAGDFHLQATSPARMAGTSSSDLGAFPYAPGSVNTIVVTPTAPSVAAGGTQTFTATAYDTANQPIPGVTFTWSSTAAAGSINQSGVLTASCALGTATAGVTASAAGKSGSANVTIVVGPTASVTISPPTVSLVAGGTQQYTATPKDACNNNTNATVSWSVAPGKGSITAGGMYTATCALGTHSNAVIATVGAFSPSATVTTTLGPLAVLSVSPQNPSLPAGGQQQFAAQGADACANAVSASVTWSSNASAGSINSGGVFTANGTPGTYNNAVTATSGAISASTGINITAGNVATVTVTPVSATLTPGTRQLFTAVAKDSNNNVVAGTPTWSIVAGGGTIDAAGEVTAGNTTGTFNNTVRAQVGGISGYATLVVNPGPVASVTVTPATATLAPGGTTSFSAQVKDAFNNLRTDAVTWTANAAAGAITAGGVFTAATAPGTYNSAVTATVGTVSGTANVSVQTGALSQLTILPASATLRVGGTVGFAVTGRDGNGNVVTVTPTWLVVQGGGTINAAGIFTAGTTPGTYVDTVQVQANGLAATATVVVTVGPVVSIDLNPAYPEVDPGNSVQFTAVAKDAYKNIVTGTAFSWQASANAGTIDSSGLFTAATTPGDYSNAVTVSAGAISATASVRVKGVVPNTDGGAGGGGGSDTDGGTGGFGGGSVDFEATPKGCGCTSGGAGMVSFALLTFVLALRRRR